MQFLLQNRFRDHASFVLGYERRQEVSAHGVFDDFIVLGAAEQDTDAGVFMRTLAIAVKRFQIEGQLAQVGGLKAHCLEFEGYEALEVTMIEEQIEFEILIANLHTYSFADKSKAVTELHEEFA